MNRCFKLAPLFLLLLLVPAFAQAQGDGPNHAGLVIHHGGGRVVTACVGFSEPNISGLELLQRSGIPLVTQGSGIGAAVCKIDGEGCEYPTEDCFCRRDGTQSIYWAYSQLRAGEWMYSPLGASNTRVQPGAVEGWAWGNGDVSSGAVPPLLTFEEICAAVLGIPAPPLNRATPPVPASTAMPAVTPTAASAPPAVNVGNYVVFGLILLGVLVGLLLAGRRR